MLTPEGELLQIDPNGLQVSSEVICMLLQPVVLFEGRDVISNGMASDQAGHFYAASGDQGSSACEPNRSGALIMIPVDDNGLPLG